MSLTGPDLHRLRAAVGWLELGSPQDALLELDGLDRSACGHEDVLETRWQVLAGLKRWVEAVGVAGALKIAVPERAAGWLQYSYALRRAPGGGLQRAFDALRPAVEKFPEEPTIPYNLACYACQMQREKAETLSWLERAMEVRGTRAILEMALQDADLEPLYPEIRQMARSRME